MLSKDQVFKIGKKKELPKAAPFQQNTLQRYRQSKPI